MSDQWESYFTFLNEEPAAMLVDLGISESSPDPDRPLLLTLQILMNSPNQDGFPDDQEESTLVAIEDSFIDAVELTTGGVLVGRVTSQGFRQFYFYAKSAEGFDDTIEEAMESHGNYRFETEVEEDAEWSTYFDLLCPAKEDLIQIFNREEIERLSEQGDSLTTERSVDHYACFPSEDDRTQFVGAIRVQGYEVVDQKFDNDPESELPYEVSLRRQHAVDWDTMDATTMDLFEVAERCHGEYEGWSSPIVKSPA
jgi:uncharacterized protein (TIGR01619 family)